MTVMHGDDWDAEVTSHRPTSVECGTPRLEQLPCDNVRMWFNLVNDPKPESDDTSAPLERVQAGRGFQADA